MSRRTSILEGVCIGNGVEPTPTSLKIVSIVMWYDCIRKLKGHACMTMRKKGTVFLKNTKTKWTRLSLLVVSLLFLLRFPQEPGRYRSLLFQWRLRCLVYSCPVGKRYRVCRISKLLFWRQFCLELLFQYMSWKYWQRNQNCCLCAHCSSMIL